jgi:hypothetical protein
MKTNTKTTDFSNVKVLNKAEQAKVMGGMALGPKPKKPKPVSYGIAIAVAGAAKALGDKVNSQL